MDKFRRYGFAILAAILFVLLLMEWNKDYPPKQVKQQSAVTQTASAGSTSQTHSGSYVPTTFNPATITKDGAVDKSQKAAPVIPKQGIISVNTDLMKVGINPLGGNIISASLLKYPVSVDKPHQPIQILTPDESKLYVTQSGLTDTGSNSPVQFHATQNTYTLGNNKSELVVTLKGHSANGLNVVKTFAFKPNSYAVDVKTTVTNNSPHTWTGSFYHQVVRRYVPIKHSFLHRQSYSGAAVSTPTKVYDQLSFSTMAKKDFGQTVKGGWVAMQQPYFLSTWVQPKNDTSHFYSHSQGDGDDGANNVFTLGYVGAQNNVAPKASVSNSSTLYIGPELADQLVKVDPTLTHTVDYGWLAPVSVFLFTVLSWIHAVIGNWGWAIIIITILIKVVFFYLSDKSYKSMAKMREAQPRIKQLQERFAGDKQALQKATMEFYKKEKLNPMGGCLPMLIQIPVFFALYYMLMESVQLRQAPWIWWIRDLSIHDPLYILPILMGASMFLQQRLSPAPPDPTQAKVMMIMPVFMTVIFLWFPAGLVLYWLTNNVVSLIHQWYVLKTYDPKKAQYQNKNKKRKKK